MCTVRSNKRYSMNIYAYQYNEKLNITNNINNIDKLQFSIHKYITYIVFIYRNCILGVAIDRFKTFVLK